MGHHRRAGLGVESGAHKVMAVAIVALQGDEQIAFLEGAGVDRDAVHGKRLAGVAQRGGFGFQMGPQRHAARPPKAIAASIAWSRSEKGCTSPFLYWTVSWALPAWFTTLSELH